MIVLGDGLVSGGGNGQKFGEAVNDGDDDGLEGVHYLLFRAK